MRLGFTGTRKGMTSAQRDTFASFLGRGWVELHHGDCVGADADAHDIATSAGGIRIEVHPPTDDTLRAFKRGHGSREPRTHFARNRAIVDECHHLVAVPCSFERQERGGTWYTVDYAAKRVKKPVWIIWPDGRLEEYRGKQLSIGGGS